MTTETTCPDCLAAIPATGGPVHAYIPAPPGCWALYGEVLAREYSDRALWPTHRLTVDAYAAQHPSGDDPRQLQSPAQETGYLAFMSSPKAGSWRSASKPRSAARRSPTW